jgi:hypothetical protein
MCRIDGGEKKLKITFTLVLALVLTTLGLGCSSTTTVDSDYDHDIDFTKYKTFGWYDHSDSKYKPERGNQIVDTRIHRAITEELVKKGFTQAPTDEADILITYHTSSEEKIEVYNSGYGYGYGGWGGYWGMGYGGYGGYGGMRAYQYDVGTLIIDIIDGAKNDLVWRGMIQKTLSKSDSTQEKINSHVTRILLWFPPLVIPNK